jgi:hypothetical protein
MAFSPPGDINPRNQYQWRTIQARTGYEDSLIDRIKAIHLRRRSYITSAENSLLRHASLFECRTRYYDLAHCPVHVHSGPTELSSPRRILQSCARSIMRSHRESMLHRFRSYWRVSDCSFRGYGLYINVRGVGSNVYGSMRRVDFVRSIFVCSCGILARYVNHYILYYSDR